MMKLTVAIPNYNGGENLKRSIESCKWIKVPKNDYEILIADNKSTDDSIGIVNDMKKEFTNIRLIQNEKNLGRIQNWNAVIEKTQSKYLIFLFSNDLINEDGRPQQTRSPHSRIALLREAGGAEEDSLSPSKRAENDEGAHADAAEQRLLGDAAGGTPDA